MNIENSQQLVERFHQLIGAPIADKPKLLETENGRCMQAMQCLTEAHARIQAISLDDPLLQRLTMCLEETIEWLEAHLESDLVAAADALGDRAYLLVGDAVATGIPLGQVFAEVHRSNMTKKSDSQSWQGKGVKSSGFNGPDLSFVLNNQLQNLDLNKGN